MKHFVKIKVNSIKHLIENGEAPSPLEIFLDPSSILSIQIGEKDKNKMILRLIDGTQYLTDLTNFIKLFPTMNMEHLKGEQFYI